MTGWKQDYCGNKLQKEKKNNRCLKVAFGEKPLSWINCFPTCSTKTCLPSSGLKDIMEMLKNLVMKLMRSSAVFSESQKIQLTQRVMPVQRCMFHSRSLRLISSYLLFALFFSEALKDNTSLNSPGNLFVTRFVLLISFLLSSTQGCCWSQTRPQLQTRTSLEWKCVSLCFSFCVLVHLQFVTLPSRRQDPLGDSQEITPCSHIIPSSSSLLTAPPPPQSSWHSYSATICCRNVPAPQFFWKAISFFTLVWDLQ